MHTDDRSLSRRTVALGTAGAGAALFTAGSVSTAQAAQRDPFGPSAEAAGPPGGARINSAPIGGYSYLFRNWSDFHALDGGARTWSPQGAYSTAGTGQFLATAAIPPGALLRDVEWYASSTVAAVLRTGAWTTGFADLVLIADTNLAAGAAGLRAQRTIVPASAIGPYPHGTMVTFFLVANGNTRINGVRLGYTMGPAGTVLLPSPVRIYDSRRGAKIGNGQTRVHNFSARIPAGATGAILNVTATGGEKSGGLAVYNPGSSLPAGSLLSFNGGTTVSNEIHTKLPSDRKVKVTMRGVSGSKTHYFIDLVGYTA